MSVAASVRRTRAADAAVTGYPITPALAVTSERRVIAMNCITFTVRPCAAGTCARRSAAWRNMCGRAYALRERSRPRCAMCDERRRRLEPGHAFCYLCRPDDNAERAQVSRPGRLAQSPRRLQPLAAPALQAGYGVQVSFDHPDPRRGLGSHTPRIPDAGGAIRTLGMHFRVQAPLLAAKLLLDRAYAAPIHDRHTPIIIASMPVTAIVSSPCTPEYRSLRRHPGPGIPERAPYCACP